MKTLVYEWGAAFLRALQLLCRFIRQLQHQSRAPGANLDGIPYSSIHSLCIHRYVNIIDVLYKYLYRFLLQKPSPQSPFTTSSLCVRETCIRDLSRVQSTTTTRRRGASLTIFQDVRFFDADTDR